MNRALQIINSITNFPIPDTSRVKKFILWKDHGFCIEVRAWVDGHFSKPIALLDYFFNEEGRITDKGAEVLNRYAKWNPKLRST